MLEDDLLRDTFDVRPVAPKVALFANLGAVQLNYGVRVEDARRLGDALRSDARRRPPARHVRRPSGRAEGRAVRKPGRGAVELRRPGGGRAPAGGRAQI